MVQADVLTFFVDVLNPVLAEFSAFRGVYFWRPSARLFKITESVSTDMIAFKITIPLFPLISVITRPGNGLFRAILFIPDLVCNLLLLIHGVPDQ